MSGSNSEKWLKSVYIYGSYCKNKIGVPFFGPPCRCIVVTWPHGLGLVDVGLGLARFFWASVLASALASALA